MFKLEIMLKLFRITTVAISLNGIFNGQLSYINKFYEVTGVSSPDPVLYKVEANEGIRVIPIKMTRIISPFKDLYSLWILYKLFRIEKPQIVHTHTPKAGTLGMLAAWLSHVPIRIHTIAGLPLLETTGIKRRLLDFIEKITYACATKIYPNSFGLKEIIIKNKYCHQKKLHVIANGSSNGIDMIYFSKETTNLNKSELREKLNIQDKDFVFCFLGRLVKDKGINELLSAFEKLYCENSEIKLILVGFFEKDLSPLEVKTEKLISHHPGIIFMGHQEDVRPYYVISDALAFPSYREGFPNVVMQAGAMGLPSIVTDINGCNEIIIEKLNGMIIPPKDELALYNTMKYFVQNKDKVAQMAINARRLIESRYEQKMVWNAILDEYKSLEIRYINKCGVST